LRLLNIVFIISETKKVEKNYFQPPSTSWYIKGFTFLLEQIPSQFFVMLSLSSRKAFACDINPDVDFLCRTFLLHSDLS